MRILLVTACALMMALPVAQGAAEVRFLADGESGPVADGVLLLEQPAGQNASVRQVLPAPVGDETTRFALPNATTGERLQGRAFAGLWLAQSPSLPMHVEMTLWMDDGSGPVELAMAGVDHGGGDPPVPQDPTTLIPPDPSDPQAAAFYVVAQAYPMIMSPPVLLDLGDVDQDVPEGASFWVSFHLASNSTALVGVLEYDSILTPSFVWLPWAEPPSETTTSTSTTSSTSSGTTSPGGITVGPGEPTTQSSDSPVAWPVVLVGLALALWARRR